MRPIEAITSVWSFTAASRAPQPGVEATASASAASCCATSPGIFGGGFGVARCPEEPPQPTTRSAKLDTATKALRQRIRQPPFANLVLGSLDRVGDAPKPGTPGPEVEQQPGRAWIAVPRLP